MKVGVLCEFSGEVRDAFIRLGHHAVSCDIIPSEKPGPHVIGDCLKQDWSWADLLICFPPCTRLCNSGVRWLRERSLWPEMIDAAVFFRSCLELGQACACENPVMHGYAQKIVGRGPDQTFQPWHFGHGEVKRTCLWLRGVPPLKHTNVVEGREARIHRMSPGEHRSRERGRTYRGIAEAMAAQWGGSVE